MTTPNDGTTHAEGCHDIVERLRGVVNLTSASDERLRMRLMQEAADEIERLRAEIDRLIDPNFVSMTVRNGGLDMQMEGTACRLFAEWFASEFQRSGGVNYIECQFASQEVMPGEVIVVTVQRAQGQTPHQLRQSAERERDELRAENAAIREVADEAELNREGVKVAHAELKALRARIAAAPVVVAIRNTSTEAAIFARDLPASWIGKRVRLVVVE